MSGFEVPGSLLALPDGPDGVRRLAEDFLLAWDVGLPEPWDVADARLDEAQARLGVRVPSVLRWFLVRFTRHHPVVGRQDPLVRAENLAVEDGALVFRNENQFCASWGVRVEDLALPDPPVVWRADGPWLPYHDRLSLDLLEWLLGETVLSLHGSTSREVDPQELDAVEGLVPLPLRAHAFWAGSSPSQWFALPDVLLRLDGETWLWACGRTPDALRRVVDALPGDWVVVD